VLGPKVLELCAVGACFMREFDEVLGALEVAIVVCGNIGNKLGRFLLPDVPVSNGQAGHESSS